MMKYIPILLAVFVLAECGKVAPPKGECKRCDETIKSVFDMASSFAVGMIPLTMYNQSICKVVNITEFKNITNHGKSCMITEDKKNFWQITGFKLTNMKVKCTIGSPAELIKLAGLKLPMLPPMKTNKKEAASIIVVFIKELAGQLQAKINFENDVCEIVDLSIEQGKLDSMQITLEGNSLLTKLGGQITKLPLVKNLLGGVVKFIVSAIIGQFVNDKQLKEVLTMLNCGNEDY